MLYKKLNKQSYLNKINDYTVDFKVKTDEVNAKYSNI